METFKRHIAYRVILSISLIFIFIVFARFFELEKGMGAENLFVLVSSVVFASILLSANISSISISEQHIAFKGLVFKKIIPLSSIKYYSYLNLKNGSGFILYGANKTTLFKSTWWQDESKLFRFLEENGVELI